MTRNRRTCQHPEASRRVDWESMGCSPVTAGTPYFCERCGDAVPDPDHPDAYFYSLIAAVVLVLVVTLLAWTGVLFPLMAAGLVVLALLLILAVIITVVEWVAAAVRLFRLLF